MLYEKPRKKKNLHKGKRLLVHKTLWAIRDAVWTYCDQVPSGWGCRCIVLSSSTQTSCGESCWWVCWAFPRNPFYASSSTFSSRILTILDLIDFIHVSTMLFKRRWLTVSGGKDQGMRRLDYHYQRATLIALQTDMKSAPKSNSTDEIRANIELGLARSKVIDQVWCWHRKFRVIRTLKCGFVAP